MEFTVIKDIAPLHIAQNPVNYSVLKLCEYLLKESEE